MRLLKLVTVLAVVGIGAGAVAQSKAHARRPARNTDSQPPPLDPRTSIPFHGRLTDASGNGINSQVNLTFAFYKSQQSTSVYWSEQHSLTPQDGWFSVVLGDIVSGGTEFPADWDGTELWLGITVQGDSEMSPRTPLLPVPYAAIANPTQHAFSHEYGGTDELGSSLSSSNELVRANGNGTIDPGWLPPASNGLPGVVTLNVPDGGPGGVVTGSDPRLSDKRVPLPHGSTHLEGGSDAIASTTAQANKVAQAGASGKLDIGWLLTSSSGSPNTIPVSSGNTLALSWLPISQTVSSSALPVVNSSTGKLDPSWLPAATNSSLGAVVSSQTAAAGTVPLGGGVSGRLDPSWLPAASIGAAGAVLAAQNATPNAAPLGSAGTGKLDPSWFPSATNFSVGAVLAAQTATPNAAALGGAGGKLDPSWLPSATVSTAGAVTTSVTAVPGAVPVGTSPNGKLDISWITAHAATHKSGSSDPVGTITPGSPNAIPYANGTGYLDNWIQKLPVGQGGTGTAAPAVTRNLCFFIAGPSASTNIPTLMVPPGVQGCSATALYASSATAPAATVSYNVSRLSGGAPGNLFVTSGSWGTGLSNIAPGGSTAVSVSDVLSPAVSAGVNNATVCVQLTCTATF